MVDKVLKAAMADADEQQADVDTLYVQEARVDEEGIRLGTKRWIPRREGGLFDSQEGLPYSCDREPEG